MLKVKKKKQCIAFNGMNLMFDKDTPKWLRSGHLDGLGKKRETILKKNPSYVK